MRRLDHVCADFIVRWCRACTKTRWWADAEKLSIVLCCVGSFILLIGMFMPRWRVDPLGTRDIEHMFVLGGYPSRQYGLLFVKGSFTQSWNTVVNSICDARTIVAASSTWEVMSSTWTDVWNGQALAGGPTQLDCGSSCSSGFYASMEERCRKFEGMATISNVALGLSLMGVLFCLSSGLLAALSKSKRMGGVVFGLFFFAGMICLASNITWAFVTDSGFKRIRETSWYPYPSLGIGWYFHLYGSVMILVADGVYGYLVLPEAWNFDPVQSKIDKREKRRQRLKLGTTGPWLEMGQFTAQAPAPGQFTAQAPAPTPYAQQAPVSIYLGQADSGFGAPPAHQQPHLQYSGGAIPQPPMPYGQGPVRLSAGTDFGLAAPTSYDQGPPSGYGMTAPTGGYGVAPPTGGYGMAPPQQYG